MTDTIRKFRTGYVAAFGAADPEDMLYEAVSEGRRYPGMEHWLPLFHDKLDTLFDYVPGAPIVLEAQAEDAARERIAQIKDYYEARKEALAEQERDALQAAAAGPALSARSRMGRTAEDRGAGAADAVRGAGGRAARRSMSAPAPGHNFRRERAENAAGVFDAVSRHVQALQAAGKRVVIALWSEGARERMKHVLTEHGLHNLSPAGSWPEALALPKPQVALAVLGLEGGFETEDTAVVSEQDILGDRLVRPRRAAKRSDNFIAEVTSLSAGDLVVHVDHGIGRFIGLQNIEAAGAPHDCLEIHYAGGRQALSAGREHRALSRYGSEDTDVELDRLGGTGWQTRKARMKNRIREIAHELIKIAAERQLREAPRLSVARRRIRRILPPAFPTRKPTTSRPRSMPRSTIWARAARWTGSFAATSASARPKWRCARPSPR